MGNWNDRLQNMMRNKSMLLIVGGLGVLLMFNPFSLFGGGSNQTPNPTADSVVVNTQRPTMEYYESIYAKRLTEMLNMAQGISDVSVMVTIESSEENVFAEDTQKRQQTTKEHDKTGGEREITQIDQSGKIVMYKQNGQDQPVIVKTIKPKVRGVVVAAHGAEILKNQALITEAVQRALDVPPHKISILPKK